MAVLKQINSETFINGNFIEEVEPLIEYKYGRIYNTRRVKLKCLECGKEFIVRLNNAIKLQQKYCGRKCSSKQKMLTDVLTKDDPLYTLWINMKSRCNYPKNIMYHNYGGRGITYEKSFESFLVFREYVLSLPNAPTKFPTHLEIDRINVDGNYERGNLRWVTLNQNRANRQTRSKTGHRNINLTVDGTYAVGFTRDGKRLHVGTFKTLSEAIKAKEDYIKTTGIFY